MAPQERTLPRAAAPAQHSDTLGRKKAPNQNHPPTKLDEEEARVLDDLHAIEKTLSKMDDQQVHVIPVTDAKLHDGSFESTRFESRSTLNLEHKGHGSPTQGRAAAGRTQKGKLPADEKPIVRAQSASKIPVTSSMKNLQRAGKPVVAVKAGKPVGPDVDAKQGAQDHETSPVISIPARADTMSPAALRVHYQKKLDVEHERYQKTLEETNTRWTAKMHDLEARILNNISETNRLNAQEQSNAKIQSLTAERDKFKQMFQEANQRAERDSKTLHKLHTEITDIRVKHQKAIAAVTQHVEDVQRENQELKQRLVELTKSNDYMLRLREHEQTGLTGTKFLPQPNRGANVMPPTQVTAVASKLPVLAPPPPIVEQQQQQKGAARTVARGGQKQPVVAPVVEQPVPEQQSPAYSPVRGRAGKVLRNQQAPEAQLPAVQAQHAVPTAQQPAQEQQSPSLSPVRGRAGAASKALRNQQAQAAAQPPLPEVQPEEIIPAPKNANMRQRNAALKNQTVQMEMNDKVQQQTNPVGKAQAAEQQIRQQAPTQSKPLAASQKSGQPAATTDPAKSTAIQARPPAVQTELMKQPAAGPKKGQVQAPPVTVEQPPAAAAASVPIEHVRPKPIRQQQQQQQRGQQPPANIKVPEPEMKTVPVAASVEHSPRNPRKPPMPMDASKSYPTGDNNEELSRFQQMLNRKNLKPPVVIPVDK